MGILRRLREWREDKDGTLIGPNIDAGSVNTGEVNSSLTPATDDDLQAKIDNAGTDGHVRLGPGAWTIDSALTLDGYDGITIEGVGYGTVLEAGTVSGSMIEGADLNDITLKNIALDVNSQGVDAIRLDTLTDSRLSEMAVFGGGDSNTGISLGEATVATPRHGNWIQNNYVQNFDTGIEIRSKSQQYSRIAFNHVFSCPTNGIRSTSENLQFVGNTITGEGGTNTVYALKLDDVGKATVVGNTLNHVTRGVDIANGATAVHVGPNKFNVINVCVAINGCEANTVQNIGGENIGADAILLDGSGATRNVIENNYLGLAFEKGADSAIKERNTATGNVIRNNVESTSAGTPYQLNSTANVSGNVTI